jgi:hypothetical protein
VSSDDPSCGDEVARAKDALAAAIERGHPSLVLRPPRHGRARRRDEQHPDGEPGSASALLERTIRGWPRRSAFSVMFVLVALALYAGVIALLATVDFPFLYDGETLDLGLPAVRWIVAVLALAVPAGAIWLQPRLFPAVEVATLTSARRALRLLGSWASIPVVAGAITQLPFVADLFK